MNPFFFGLITGLFVCLLTVMFSPTSIPYVLRKNALSKSLRGNFFESLKYEDQENNGNVTEKKSPIRIGHGLWIGLMISTIILSFFQGLYDQTASLKSFGFGPGLLWLLFLSLPLWIVSFRSDLFQPKSEWHIFGLVLSGIAMSFLGYHIFILTNPLSGTTALSPIISVILTVIWLILFASILEVVSLIPYGVTVLVLALTGMVVVGGGLEHSIASNLLAGLLPGALIGRLIALKITGKKLRYGKAEIFLLGLWATAMLNVSFLKSVALVGVVLPVGAFTTIIIILMIRAFEGSLILRETPRS